MITNIFTIIQLIMTAFRVWDAFLDWLEERHIAIRHEKAEAREAAIKAGVDAQTDDDIWAAQKDIVKNLPTP